VLQLLVHRTMVRPAALGRQRLHPPVCILHCAMPWVQEQEQEQEQERDQSSTMHHHPQWQVHRMAVQVARH